MPSFSYTAVGENGRSRQGRVDAASVAAATRQVEALGLVPVDVAEERVAAAARGRGWRGPRPAENPGPGRGPGEAGDAPVGRVRATSLHNFMRQLASLMTAGVPLSRALDILGRESSSPAASALWGQINREVSDGTTLADAMSHHPRTFADVHVAMVRAGETGGFLEVVLQQIADFMSRERELKSRVLSAMIYPAVLAVVATGVVIFLLSWFIPRFSAIFDDFGQSLPLLTRVVRGASAILLSYGPFVALAVVAAAFAIRQGLTSERGRRLRDRWLLPAPVVGHVVARFALIRFCRMLGTLVGAGVPLVNALNVSRQAIGNQVLSDALGDAIHRVQQGESLAGALRACPLLFPPSVTEVVAVAEEAGQMDRELVRLADENEQDLDRRLRMLVALAEPALLFVMAAVVGTIVVGMLLPVFDLWNAIQ